MAGLLPAVLSALLIAGCETPEAPRFGIGPKPANLQVVNKTQREYYVRVELPQARAVSVVAIVRPGESFAWDLPGGEYRLLAMDANRNRGWDSFQTTCRLTPGQPLVWPLLAD